MRYWVITTTTKLVRNKNQNCVAKIFAECWCTLRGVCVCVYACGEGVPHPRLSFSIQYQCQTQTRADMFGCASCFVLLLASSAALDIKTPSSGPLSWHRTQQPQVLTPKHHSFRMKNTLTIGLYNIIDYFLNKYNTSIIIKKNIHLFWFLTQY